MRTKAISLALFIIVILALFINHHFYFHGHFGYDDMHYARLASNSLERIFDWSDHYNYRITIIFATALSYSFFGINDFASMLPAMLLSIVIIGCFYQEFKEHPFLFAISILLYFSFQWNLFYSDKLAPDIYVSTFGLLGWLIYDKNKSNTSTYAPLLSAIYIFIAFNAKGTIVVLIPLFMVYALSDLFQRKYWFWKRFSLSLAIMMLLYFGILFLITGCPFSRFQAIGQSHYVNPCSYSIFGQQAIIRRLTIDYFNYIVENHFYVYYLVAFLGFIKSYRNGRRAISLDYMGIFILLITVNFLPLSISPYNPFCLEPRHSIAIVPILVICATRVIYKCFPFYHRYIAKLFLITVLLYLNIPTVQYAQYCKKLNYPRYKNDFKAFIEDSQLIGKIYGSTVFKNTGDYYLEFKKNSDLQFESYEELSDCHDPILICRNWYSEWHANLEDDDIQDILKERGCMISDEPIYRSPLKDLWIYKSIELTDTSDYK